MTWTDDRVRAWLAETREWADHEIERALADLDCGPARHEEALRYVLFGGGKRLRSALVRMTARHLGGTDADAGPPAAAVEMIHAYSLVHDDLPCMDDDDVRRGRPTCHRAYSEGEAVLVGDGLQALAFEWLAGVGGDRGAELVRVLARAAGPGGMVGGQVDDVLASGERANRAEVEGIHRRKTAALLAAAVELGAVAVGSDDDARVGMRRYGEALGMCFQAIDDVLDVTGDPEAIGKTPGKDAAEDKATLVSAVGLAEARREAERQAEAARALALAAGFREGDLAPALPLTILRRPS